MLSHEATEGENLGVIVDEVNSVNSIKISQIEALGESFENISSQAYIQGIIMMDSSDGISSDDKKKEKDLVIFLNMHGLINGLSKFQ